MHNHPKQKINHDLVFKKLFQWLNCYNDIIMQKFEMYFESAFLKKQGLKMFK